MRTILLLCLSLSLNQICLGQDIPFPVGRILDSVPLEQHSSESYALYLPKAYDTDSSQPIVFIFDPAARGRTGIEPFVEASEKYQMILVCSNNSRNTAYEENFEIANRWFEDVFSRFTVDQGRIYAAGFSGGSRLASTIGVLTGAFKAVVGCGAGFSGNPGQMPYTSDHFYYAGLTGHLDMNFQEMKRAGNWLDRIGLPNRFYFFEGDHRWPEPEVIVQAFDWFYLQDIKKGIAGSDQEFLDAYLHFQLREADRFFKEDRVVEAVLSYESLVEDLDPFFELDSITERINNLKKESVYKRRSKEITKIASEEKAWTDKLVGRISQDIAQGKTSPEFNWWNKTMRRLEEEVVQHELKDYQYMGRRLNNMLFAVVVENLDAAAAQFNEKDAEYYIQLSTALWSGNPYVYFRAATAYAKLDKDQEAIRSLEKAVEKGWNNRQWIAQNPTFSSLKEKKEFQDVLQKLPQ